MFMAQHKNIITEETADLNEPEVKNKKGIQKKEKEVTMNNEYRRRKIGVLHKQHK